MINEEELKRWGVLNILIAEYCFRDNVESTDNMSNARIF